MTLLLSISVISAATVAYEILLMRLFSIIQWHHYAYFVISLALLGFGASGTYLSLAQGWLQSRFETAFAGSAALFGVFALASFSLAQWVPFNPLALAWDPIQFLYISLIYLILTVPFFCAGLCIGLALRFNHQRLSRIYAFDLAGAGFGALGIVAILFLVPAEMALRTIAVAGIAAGAIACAGFVRLRSWATILAIGAVALGVGWPDSWIEPQLSEYKGLSHALRLPDAEIVSERSSPLGTLTVVRNPTIPFRYAPGLSLNSIHTPPEQLAVYSDGDAPGAITEFSGDTAPLAYLDDQTQALPYQLIEDPKVLVLGAGGGADVLLALYHHAKSIDAVELNPQMVELVNLTHGEFAGRIYQPPAAKTHLAEARSFATTSKETFDLVVVSLLDSFTAASAGVHALSETTLYTVEALRDFHARLAPNGILAITRWLKLPPRDGLKLFGTTVTALEMSDISDPGSRLALIRGWKTSTLLVKNGVFSEDEIDAIREFCEARSFDIGYLPGMRAEEANRRNVFAEAYLYAGAKALLGPRRADFLDSYKFNVTPATDDRPFFFHFFKWRLIAEIFDQPLVGRQLAEWGYLVVAATLAQALVIGTVLIALPLVRTKRPASGLSRSQRIGLAGYFLALGLAFLFIEIAFMQRFTLFLGHPLYAAAVVLSSFLFFAGIGSGASTIWASRIAGRVNYLSPIVLAVGGIIAFALIHLWALPPILAKLQILSAPLKVILGVAFIAPLAFFMGMPFPLGLSWVGKWAPYWIPWAWGLNGCASVVSAVLAVLLAIHFGFSAVVLMATLIYGLAAVLITVMDHRHQGRSRVAT